MWRVGVVGFLLSWASVARAAPQEWTLDPLPGWVADDNAGAMMATMAGSDDDGLPIVERATHSWRSNPGLVLVQWMRVDWPTNVASAEQLDARLMAGVAGLGKVLQDEPLHAEGTTLVATLTVSVPNQFVVHSVRRYIAAPDGVHALLTQCFGTARNRACNRIAAGTHFAVAGSTPFTEGSRIDYYQLGLLIGGLATIALGAVFLMRWQHRRARGGRQARL